MDKWTKLLLSLFLSLTILSVVSSYYKSVVQQDFDITGIWVEFYYDETSYVYFVYDNEEYEIEPETTNYKEILEEISAELDIPTKDLDSEFIEYMEQAYKEAKYVEITEEEIEVNETIEGSNEGEEETPGELGANSNESFEDDFIEENQENDTEARTNTEEYMQDNNTDVE